eukprot:TRINITY_DN6877_c0_g1_i1.p1 TRINITY_DN6877_c0_g1~~TRINITY_DN6877_c0_g1_i1.p1  ORF type:complete len:304 (+),score=42.20 TRINITY_DN6877_c0_g1_i1:53-964(+)
MDPLSPIWPILGVVLVLVVGSFSGDRLLGWVVASNVVWCGVVVCQAVKMQWKTEVFLGEDVPEVTVKQESGLVSALRGGRAKAKLEGRKVDFNLETRPPGPGFVKGSTEDEIAQWKQRVWEARKTYMKLSKQLDKERSQAKEAADEYETLEASSHEAELHAEAAEQEMEKQKVKLSHLIEKLKKTEASRRQPAIQCDTWAKKTEEARRQLESLQEESRTHLSTIERTRIASEQALRTKEDLIRANLRAGVSFSTASQLNALLLKSLQQARLATPKHARTPPRDPKPRDISDDEFGAEGEISSD